MTLKNLYVVYNPGDRQSGLNPADISSGLGCTTVNLALFLEADLYLVVEPKTQSLIIQPVTVASSRGN